MKFKVRFLPMSIEVSVERGTNLLDAATFTGVDINSSCAGNGTCHKCKVLVEGPIDTETVKGHDATRLDEGYRLACQTSVVGDLNVFVPEEARVGAHKILEHHRAAAIKQRHPLFNVMIFP
jgi:uncharacterized 2Fe-2S/4Fe-4S cluster protein (DUF4445 family)